MQASWIEEQQILLELKELSKQQVFYTGISNEDFKQDIAKWFRYIIDWLKKIGKKIKDLFDLKKANELSRTNALIERLKAINLPDQPGVLKSKSNSPYLITNNKQDIFSNGLLSERAFLRHGNGWRDYSIGNGILSIAAFRYKITTYIENPAIYDDEYFWERGMEDLIGEVKNTIKLENPKSNPGGWYVSGATEFSKISVYDAKTYIDAIKAVDNLKVNHQHIQQPDYEIVFESSRLVKENAIRLIKILEGSKSALSRLSDFVNRRDELQDILEKSLRKVDATKNELPHLKELLDLIPMTNQKMLSAYNYEWAIRVSVMRSVYDAANVLINTRYHTE